MKKKLKKTLEIACVAAVLVACILTDEAGEPCMWNYALFAFSGLAGWASKRMEEQRNG